MGSLQLFPRGLGAGGGEKTAPPPEPQQFRPTPPPKPPTAPKPAVAPKPQVRIQTLCQALCPPVEDVHSVCIQKLLCLSVFVFAVGLGLHHVHIREQAHTSWL